MRQAVLLALACLPCWAAEPGFESLFDGRTLDGWVTVARPEASGEWRAADGLLTVVGRPGHLSTTEEYGDFDLRLEWRVGPLGNSGVFYRVAKDGNPALAAIEYQLADNARPQSQANPDRRAGAAYSLYAPAADAVRPPGEWNTLRIVARGTEIEHWLNGQRVAAFDVRGKDFAQRAAAWRKGPDFAQAKAGRIVLQDHNSAVWFRSVRIKRLD